jgi:hypothetical protein
MPNADTVVAIYHDRGTRGLPLEDVYRQLFNPDHYLRAYGRIDRNTGAMTPGTTPETADGMSQEKIAKRIEPRREERYRWTPVRRVYIPKANGKMRPLGVPTWSDTLLQEVIRSLREADYEPQFDDTSHGSAVLAVPRRQRQGQDQVIMGAFAPDAIAVMRRGGDLDLEVKQLFDQDLRLGQSAGDLQPAGL